MVLWTGGLAAWIRQGSDFVQCLRRSRTAYTPEALRAAQAANDEGNDRPQRRLIIIWGA